MSAAKRAPRAATTRLDALTQAQAAAAAGRFGDAASAIETAWQAGAHPDLIPLLSRLLERAAEPGVSAAREKDTELQWHALAKRRTSAGLRTMACTRWPRLSSAAKARVRSLVSGAPHVLITVALWRLVTTDPYESSVGDWCIRTGLRALFSWKDPTAQVLLDHVLAHHRHRTATGVFSFGDLQRRRATPPIQLTEPERALLVSLQGSLAPRSDAHLADLLAAITKEPNERAHRAVYADALTELGDPRGEFISLQLMAEARPLNAAQRARERALVLEHGKPWLGALAPFVDRKMASAARAFRAGFPASLALIRKLPADAFASTHEWATVEHLVVNGSFVFHENLRSLRHLHGVDAHALRKQSLPALEHLALHGEIAQLERAAPKLQGVGHLEWLFALSSPPAAVGAYVANQPWASTLRELTTWGQLSDLRALPFGEVPSLQRCNLRLDDQGVAVVQVNRAGDVTLLIDLDFVGLSESLPEFVSKSGLTGRAVTVRALGKAPQPEMLAVVTTSLERLGITVLR